MWIRRLSGRSPVRAALPLTSLALFASTARAQTNRKREVAKMRAENSAMKEELRKIEERKKTLLHLGDELQRRLDGRPSQLGNDSYTGHLGVFHPVTRRNGFSLNRNMFQFTGFIFNKRLNYNLIIWAFSTSASVVTGDSSKRSLHCFPAMACQVIGTFVAS